MSANPSDKNANDLLSWYVNGSLNDEDREQVDASVRSSRDAAASLVWEQALRSAVRNDPVFACPPELGLSRVMQRIRAEAKPAAPTRSFSDWLSRLIANISWSPAFAIACGLVAVQFGVIAQMWPGIADPSGFSEKRAVHAVPKYDAFIRVSFRQDTRESDLRTLVRSVHAEVVAGPSQIGDYFLLVPNLDAQSAVAILKASARIESVEIVDELPAKQ